MVLLKLVAVLLIALVALRATSRLLLHMGWGKAQQHLVVTLRAIVPILVFRPTFTWFGSTDIPGEFAWLVVVSILWLLLLGCEALVDARQR